MKAQNHPCANGCGRIVSAARINCLQCDSDLKAGMDAKKDAPEVGSTHVVVIHESQDQEDLYRADGMLVASRQKDLVRFGHDIATAQTRIFLNAELAAEWLRKLAAVDIFADRLGKPLYEVIWQYNNVSETVQVETRKLEKNLVIPATLKLN